jgi:hypothetical protein
MKQMSNTAVDTFKRYISECEADLSKLCSYQLENICNDALPGSSEYSECLCLKWYLQDVLNRYSGGGENLLPSLVRLEVGRAKQLPGTVSASSYLLSMLERSRDRMDIKNLALQLKDVSKGSRAKLVENDYMDYAALLVTDHNYGIFVPERLIQEGPFLTLNRAVRSLLDNIQPQLDFKVV